MHNRREFLKTTVLGASLLPFADLSSADAPNKPDILLILADDLAWNDAGCYGNPDIRTPHIDNLAKQGLQFTQAFTATAMRVPTLNVTAMNLVVQLACPVTPEAVNQTLSGAAQGRFRDIMAYEETPLASIDFNHDPHSRIVDGTQTRVSGGDLASLLVWCDNEWGFANRMLDTATALTAGVG